MTAPPKTRFAPPLLLLCVIPNLALLALYYLPAPKRLVGDEGYYYNLGKAFAGGEPVIHNPLWPRLYGDFLGGMYRIFGIQLWPVQLIQITFWLLSGVLIIHLARRLGANAHMAPMIAALFLLSPEVAAFSHYLWPEIPHMFFMLAGFWALLRNDKDLLSPMVAGVALGLALISKLLLGPFIPICGLFLWVATQGTIHRKALRLLIFGAAIIVTLTPTLMINKMEFGQAMIADSSVFNLWTGLTDVEKRDHRNDRTGEVFVEFQASGQDLAARNRIYREKIIERIRDQGVVDTIWGQCQKQYFRLLGAETFLTTQLAGGPRSAYHLNWVWVNRFIHFWSHAYHALLLVLIALGVARFDWRRPDAGWLLFLFLIYNAALFLLVHVKTRYTVQLVPIVLLWSLAHSGDFKPRDLLPTTIPRRVLGLALSLLLLWTAFTPPA